MQKFTEQPLMVLEWKLNQLIQHGDDPVPADNSTSLE